MNKNSEYTDFVIDLINVLSFVIGLQNLDMNNQQVADLQEHLNKQDEQYAKIISLLEEHKSFMKGE